ncbi:MAG: cell division protein ZapB [Pseudomonadota bacterium]
MTEDIILSQFGLLEEKVSQLIAKAQLLEEENKRLIARIDELETTAHEQAGECRRLLEERSAIKDKIDSVLLKFDSLQLQ